MSVLGTTPLSAAVSMAATASIAVAGKIEQFVDAEEFIVYINTSSPFTVDINTLQEQVASVETSVGTVVFINTSKSVDGNIETFREFEG